jgi:hypothetical protein
MNNVLQQSKGFAEHFVGALRKDQHFGQIRNRLEDPRVAVVLQRQRLQGFINRQRGHRRMALDPSVTATPLAAAVSADDIMNPTVPNVIASPTFTSTEPVIL